MSKSRDFTCISCPLGCSVTVTPVNEGLSVSGNECRLGEEYTLQEYRDPRRILTGTVIITGADLPRLPVKTDGAIPKSMIPDAAEALSRIVVNAPVQCGAVLEQNFAGSGVNLIATRDLGVLGTK
jgi:CxxC motif-containing protein